MRVLIVNTSEKTGGAAVAANRLKDALNNNGVKAKMLVRDKETDDITVVGLPNSLRLRFNFLWERFCIYLRLHFSKTHLFEIDIANAGADITTLPEFKEADVIHLSWINQGMLSLRGIRKILASGKSVVWTMHDIWPATAICHYSHQCNYFKSACKHCYLLPGGGGDNDLAASVWRKKQNMLKGANIFFVSCSRWLEAQAKQSALLMGQHVTSIPNPIDTHVFCRRDKADARCRVGLPLDKKIILFVSQRVTDKRKGMDYFIDAVRQWVDQQPERKEDTAIAILGGHSEEVAQQLALPAYPLGYVSDEKTIVNVYSAVDTFVLPSLSDNLPNTIMEAMACGVPCVGFKVGGIPEEIDHLKNGYVARFRDVEDLAKGMKWVLFEADYEAISHQAVAKVARNYSQQSVAMRYIEVYNQAMAFKHFRL